MGHEENFMKKKTTKKTASKTTIKKKAVTKKAMKADERRETRRYSTPNLMVTETTGEFRYSLPAENISEGGIFLSKRLKTNDDPSKLTIHFGEGVNFEVMAQPLYDRIKTEKKTVKKSEKIEKSFGIGYCFIQMNEKTQRELKSHIRSL